MQISRKNIIIAALVFLTLLVLILWQTSGDLYIWNMLTTHPVPDPFFAEHLTSALSTPIPSTSSLDTISPSRVPDTRTWSEVFQSPIINPEIKWKTYRNGTYGFEMQYPSDWTYEIRYGEIKPVVEFIKFSSPKIGPDVEGSFNSWRLSLGIWKWSKEEYEKNNVPTDFHSGEALKKERMLINGVDCTLVNPDGKTDSFILLYCARNSYIFGFSDTPITRNRDISAYMINTFRFSK